MPRNSSSPIVMTLPPFHGAVKKLVLANVAVFFVMALLGWVAPEAGDLLALHLELIPAAVLHGEVWQVITYGFLHAGIMHILFNMLTLWFIGSYLESSFGERWLTEIYFVSLIGAGLTSVAAGYSHIFGLTPYVATVGASGAIFGLLVAFGVFFGEQQLLVFFLVQIKAKYLVAIYILLAVASLVRGPAGVAYVAHLGGALFGYLYAKWAPRRGFTYASSERYFALRNSYYRWKRRKAAKKFQVYMRKQDKEVHFDKDGRYIDPDAKKDPNDRDWMN